MKELEWNSLEGLVFEARRLVDGLYAGRHQSPALGRGVDFHDYRPYVPGDDAADVDWKVFGRTDRYYLRRYRRQTELSLSLLLDVSASMDFAGLGRGGGPADPGRPTKLHYAATLAAAIAWLTVRQGDRVSLALLAGDVREHSSPVRTAGALRPLLARLAEVRPVEGEADLAAALDAAQPLVPSRSLVVIISDLLDEAAGLLRAMAQFRHRGCEVLLFQVLSPAELELGAAEGAAMEFVDAQTGRDVRTDLRQVGRRYEELMAAHQRQIRGGCVAQHADHNVVRTDQPVVEALRKYLVRRQKSGRGT